MIHPRRHIAHPATATPVFSATHAAASAHSCQVTGSGAAATGRSWNHRTSSWPTPIDARNSATFNSDNHPTAAAGDIVENGWSVWSITGSGYLRADVAGTFQ